MRRRFLEARSMFLRAPEAHSRSLLKAVSWRLLGSIDTFVISYFVTGRLVFAASIASVETFTKIMLFYFHERAWALVPWGRSDKMAAAPESVEAKAAEPAPLAAQQGAPA
jgi:uncharacterized membrane protein